MIKKMILILNCAFLLCSCSQEPVKEIDLSKYFMGINGTAVFYNPATQQYKIYNPKLAAQRSSPCSTFKIMSSYIALSEQTVSLQNSQRKWNGTTYWHPAWNQDMDLANAFKNSCVWYYRRLIDEVGTEKMRTYLTKLTYGNQDASDWDGKLNANESNRELNGFWIESTLKISPLEQTQVLARLLSQNNQVVSELKSIMQVAEEPVKIFGKTGMGVKDNKIADAWFVGFYEQKKQTIYFAVRLNDENNTLVENYRNKASIYAKQIAVDIITHEEIF